jgi:hypothetical protein
VTKVLVTTAQAQSRRTGQMPIGGRGQVDLGARPDRCSKTVLVTVWPRAVAGAGLV